MILGAMLFGTVTLLALWYFAFWVSDRWEARRRPVIEDHGRRRL